MNKTICFQDATGKIHAWQRAKHWTDEYLAEMLSNLNKPDSENKHIYYIDEAPPEKCCQLHGAK